MPLVCDDQETSTITLLPVPQEQLALWSQADPIALGDPPEPILIEIDLACRLCDSIRRSVEQCIEEFSIIMPGMVGDAISANRVTGQRDRPRLRDIVRQPPVCHLGGCPHSGKTGSGKPDQLQISADEQADIRLPLE